LVLELMLLRLLRFGFVVALLSGGWAGALVAGACAHTGGSDAPDAATHACCRHATTDAPHCREHGEQAGGAHQAARHGAHVGVHRAGGAHVNAAAFNSMHVNAVAFNSTHAARATAQPAQLPSAQAAHLPSAQPANLCTHCLQLPTPQPASAETREPGRVRQDASRATTDAQRQPTFKSISFVRAVSVQGHAPPLNARRHVILGLFLI
jgi:hypothetical protein